MILELSGTILEAFWDDVRALFLSLLRVLWKPASSSVLVVLGTFWFTSFAKFAKWQGSFPLDNCYRFASPADPFQMFRDSMEVHWILDRVSQSVDASKTSGD